MSMLLVVVVAMVTVLSRCLMPALVALAVQLGGPHLSGQRHGRWSAASRTLRARTSEPSDLFDPYVT